MQRGTENTLEYLFLKGIYLPSKKISTFTNTNMLANMTSSLFERSKDCIHLIRDQGSMDLRSNIYLFIREFTDLRGDYKAKITSLATKHLRLSDSLINCEFIAEEPVLNSVQLCD